MENQDNLIDSFIEVKLKETGDSENPNNFLTVRETLTRIGIASKHQQTLYQSVHVLHKRGKYYLVHFKQCFMLDNKPTDFTDNDKSRLNTIANLLASWGLVELIDPNKSKEPTAPMSCIKVIAYQDKRNWNLVQKYTLGSKKYVREPKEETDFVEE